MGLGLLTMLRSPKPASRRPKRALRSSRGEILSWNVLLQFSRPSFRRYFGEFAETLIDDIESGHRRIASFDPL